jgi:hypothetical protein
MKILVPMIDNSVGFQNLIGLLKARNYAQEAELRIIMVIPNLQPLESRNKTVKTQDSLNNSVQGIINHIVAALEKALPDTQVSGKVLIGDTISLITKEAEVF